MDRIRAGDRFRASRDIDTIVQPLLYAPAHTYSVPCVVPAGTILVALEATPVATAFTCYPEDYDALERVLIRERDREDSSYAGWYALHFMTAQVGTDLEPIEPVDPRPGPDHRLPRVTGRPTKRQLRELARREALERRVSAVPLGPVTQVGERSWVRGSPDTHTYWDGNRGSDVTVSTSFWEIWIGDPPGNPPREADFTQPGGPRGVAGVIWQHDRSARPKAGY